MKRVNDTIYIEFQEAVNAGISENTIRNAKLRNAAKWGFIADPDDKRKVLIEFEKLRDEYKKKIETVYGNVYEYMAKTPIRNLVKWDDKAEEFFLAYRYNDTPLPIEHVKKYSKAASWLNMFKEQTNNKRELKKSLNLTIEQFITHSIDILKTDKIDLPTSYRRLIVNEDSALKKFIKEGYSSLIDWRFGNKHALKVNDELSQAALLKMIEHGNQHDDVFIAMQYNLWAKQNNYKPIDKGTVGNWRRTNERDITMSREGNAKLKNKFLRQAKGFRPTAPLYLVESDDNHLDLLFLDVEDPTPHKHYHRYKAIVVTDSFNDYVLGYAYAENLTTELVRAAYISAMYYIRSLTGGWHLPIETKTDRWALKELMPFYQSMGKYFPTPVGSKNRGYIENLFGSAHWKRCLKIGAKNYSGNNMTAKNRGVNQELLDRNKNNRLTTGTEANQQIENFFHRLRHMPQSDGKSKHNQWMEAWNTLPAENKRPISDEQFLLKFGITHNPKRTIRITNRGVEPQILGTRYSFDLVTPNLSDYVSKEVSVVYDPFDMSRVLVTDFEKVRLIGTTAKLNNRALQDGDTNSRTYLNAIFQERKDDVERISNRSERRTQVLESAGLDAEGLLQAGVMVKELKQAAEQRMLEEVSGKAYDEEDFFDQM